MVVSRLCAYRFRLCQKWTFWSQIESDGLVLHGVDVFDSVNTLFEGHRLLKLVCQAFSRIYFEDSVLQSIVNMLHLLCE